MAIVKVHSSSRGQTYNVDIINGLRLAGIKIYKEPQDADISLVISGKHENPALLKGKKVIVFNSRDWIPFMNHPTGWLQYKKVLDEYYDDYLNITGLDTAKKVEKIRDYVVANEAT